MAKLIPQVEASVIERTRIPLDLSRELAVSLLLPALQREALAFNMQGQCHTNWCWAALAASVAAFYDKLSAFTQCVVANLELGRNDCCDVPCHTDNVGFNQIHEPGAALNRVDCLDREMRNQIASRAQVQQEIDAGRPLCLRTVWSKGNAAGGAHALAIVGYFADSDTLALEDPWFGPTHDIPYDQFCTNYKDFGGKWTDTYYTMPAKTNGIALGG
jgi:Papain-like cysteine protease AvrRpt2